MEESGDHRDTENNWVIPNTEGLPVDTLGHEVGHPPPGREAVKDAGAEAAIAPDREEPAVPEVKGPESASPPQGPESTPPITEVPPHQEQLNITPEEPEKSQSKEPSPGLRRRLGGDLEEVSCSSSEDDVEGLRKRAARGAPPTNIGPAPREAVQLEEDTGFSLTLNKCVIAAVALVALAVLVFTGGLGGDEDPPQSVIPRSARGGDQAPETITDLQEWLHQHADQFSGDPNSLQVMNDLLDKVAKENQEIRHLQARLQAQKEELEALLQGGGQVALESQHLRLTEENVRLKDALLREETGHLSAKEEVQDLQEKLETLEADDVEKEALTSESAQLKADLEASRSQIEGFLTQKETLVAESQMLRQELDKQRSLVASIRQDLEGMEANSTEERGLGGRITEMSSRLAMEAQRSETWEKKYVEHAQRRKELVGEEKRPHGRKEWRKGDKWSKEEGPRRPHFKPDKEHGKRWAEDGPSEAQHKEWKAKKSEEKKQREAEKTGSEDRGGWEREPPRHNPDNERNWKDKHTRHHHGDAGFHPRKGQKEFLEAHKHGEDKRQGDKAHGKEHRHHDHNKFWKKLSDHQYRVPEGCSGLEDCARKDGLDLFNVELKPVQRKRFEEILQTYLTRSDLSKHLPELVPLLDGFFEGPHFSHHKIRFKDFVDDVEDFLEDLARKETGNDDLVDDFESFVYTNFFGEAAIRKRSKKKDRRSYKLERQHNPRQVEETSSESDLNQANPKYTKDAHKVDYPNHKPYKTHEHPKHGSPSHRRHEEGNDHGWKKHQKDYAGDGTELEKSGPYFNKSLDSTNEKGMWHFKMSKYNDGNNGYRSFQEDHRDSKEGGRRFREQEPYRKRQEREDGRGHQYQRNKHDTEDHRHQHGKDRHGDESNPSSMDHNEDTKRPFYRDHEPYRKKDKDAINERYRSSQLQSDKREHKPWKDGEDHHHEHKPWKEGEGHHHEHKPWKDGEGHHHEHKPWKDGEGHHHEHKPWKEGEGHRHKDKPWKEGEGHRHKDKPWKEGEGHRHKDKPWKESEGHHHKDKPWKEGEGHHPKNKPWKESEGHHHEQKPWNEREDHQHDHKSQKESGGSHQEHKSWKQRRGGHDDHKPLKQDERYHHEHKSWKEGEGHHQKQWKEDGGDRHKPKPWKNDESYHH